MKKILFIAAFIFCLQDGAYSTENTPANQDSMIWFLTRKEFSAYGISAYTATILILEYEWWWRDDYLYHPHPFRFAHDGWFNNYSLGVDKVGHLFTSYLYFHTAYDLMRWAGYSDNTSLWVALGVPASHAISIEIGDGFSKWAFSSDDLICNFLGIGYAYAQTRYPLLQNINLKWSYFPTEAVKRPDKDWGLSHDYSGHIYWISFKLHNLLPEPVGQYWPKYLSLAVGYGGKNISNGDTGKPLHKFVVALDYNISDIPVASDTWQLFTRLVDKLHLPAPGVKIYSDETVKFSPIILN